MACARERVRRRRSRGGDGVRALCARAVAGAGCPFFRRASGRWHASLRAPAVVAGFLWGTLAMHQEAGPSVQMMRVRFCLEAAEKPSYPAAYGILAMRMWSFVVLFILRCVASPYDGPTGNVSPWSRPRACSMGRRAARRARGGVPSLFLCCPFAGPGGACRAIPGGRGTPSSPGTLLLALLRHPHLDP